MYGIDLGIGTIKYAVAEGYMRWADYGSRSVIPCAWVYVCDEHGVTKKYRVRYKGNCRDGASIDITRTSLEWERPENLNLPVYVKPEVPAEIPSEWIGKIGARTQFTAVVKKIRSFHTEQRFHYYDSGFRTQTILDVNGSIVVYWNSLPVEVEEGDTVEFFAAVKNHAEYQGKKQTVITRVTKCTNKSEKKEVV
jgi:hypothetical protein